MSATIEDGLFGSDHRYGGRLVFACSQITIPAWVSATRYLQTYAVSGEKTICCWRQFDCDSQCAAMPVLARSWRQADQAIANVDRATVRKDIAQAAVEIGVWTA